MKRLAALCLLLLTAAERPQPGPRDAHVQTVFWDPEQVVHLTGAQGWQIMIEFAPDERIENVSIGDALAWQVTPNKRARNLFLKPLGRNASTNMTVITDQRRYVFSLETGPRRISTPWTVRFEYPAPPVELVADVAPPPPPPQNFDYVASGEASLAPARIWDDGQMTYFEFGPDVPIPAVFVGKPGKEETLVNSTMRGRTMVVQQLAPLFTLRIGKRVATIAHKVGGRK